MFSFFQDDKIGQSILGSVIASFITTFVLNIIYDFYVKKYIEVDRELILIKKQKQANFVEKCQIIGSNFGQLKALGDLKYYDFEHLVFLLCEQEEMLKTLRQDLPKIFHFSELDNKDNSFFVHNFAYFIGFLIGRLTTIKKCLNDENYLLENKIKNFVSYSDLFAKFDTFFAMKFSSKLLQRICYFKIILRSEKEFIKKEINTLKQK